MLKVICVNCGKVIDDDLRVCPFCGSFVEPSDDSSYYENEIPEQPPVSLPDEDPAPEQEFVDDDPAYGEPKKARGGMSLPRGGAAGGFSLATILSLLSCILALVCLISVLSLRSAISEQGTTLGGSMNDLRSSVLSLDARLGQLDNTLSGVQSEAYNQYASQAIAITKDITPLTGPVDAGKYNRMFIITAKGNLNVNDSFDWQKYNESTGGWVSLVFTGDATDNSQYGLRLENNYDRNANTYTSILWANGITEEANGTYRCVITDATGVNKTSAQATVTVN